MRPLLGTWPTTQACAPTGNRTSAPLVHSPVLSPLSHTSQGRKRTNFKDESGLLAQFLKYFLVVDNSKVEVGEEKYFGTRLKGLRSETCDD